MCLSLDASVTNTKGGFVRWFLAYCSSMLVGSFSRFLRFRVPDTKLQIKVSKLAAWVFHFGKCNWMFVEPTLYVKPQGVKSSGILARHLEPTTLVPELRLRIIVKYKCASTTNLRASPHLTRTYTLEVKSKTLRARSAA